MVSPITFSRASIGTVWDSGGVLRTRAADKIRRSYNPVTRQPLGILVEPARTNMLLQSNSLDNNVWVKTGVTRSVAPIEDPTTALSANQIRETAVNDVHSIKQTLNIVANDFYTFSGMIKAGSRTKARILFEGAALAGYSFMDVDLATGQFVFSSETEGTTGNLKKLNRDWYLFSLSNLTADNAVLQISPTIIFLNDAGETSYPGNTDMFLYGYGLQVERGLDRTSYIPTTTAAVTRARDQLLIDLTKVPFSQNGGLAEIIYQSEEDVRRQVNIMSMANSDNTRVIEVIQSPSNRIDVKWTLSPNTIAKLTSNPQDILSLVNIKFSWGPKNMRIQIGDVDAAQTALNTLTDFSKIIVGTDALQGDLYAFAGHIRGFRYLMDASEELPLDLNAPLFVSLDVDLVWNNDDEEVPITWNSNTGDNQQLQWTKD